MMFYVFPRAVRPDICDEIVNDCKQNVLENAKIWQDKQHTNRVRNSVVNFDKNSSRDDPSIRKTLVHFIHDEKNKANEVAWHFLKKANRIQFRYDLDYFQPIQFAEYKDGGFFDWHQDSSGLDLSNEVRKLSLTLVLSDPDSFEGGEFQFYSGDRPVESMGKITAKQLKNDIRSQGTVIVFDSRDWHRVTPVTKGVRHALVCWTVGPNFR
mgnify:CR=1 FL=1